MTQYIYIILCLKEFLTRIFGPHYPTELVSLIVIASYTKVKINCGWYHNIAIINNKIYGWGKNANGELGLVVTEHNNNKISPQKLNFLDVKSIKCGHYDTIWLTNGSDVYSCGQNSIWNKICTEHDEKIPLSSKLTISSITKIKYHHSPDSNLFLIGNNEIYVASPRFPENISKMQLPPDINKIKCGAQYIMALTKTGKLYSRGSNACGQLGLGHYYDIDSFQELSLSNVIMMDCGTFYTVAVTGRDQIYVWGVNKFGNLGLGDSNHRHTPSELVLSITSSIVSVCCGADHTLVLLKNDLIYVWGYNRSGQLGLGHLNCVYTPEKFYFPNVVKIYSGGNSTFAITKDDEIYAWGANNYRQLGLGDGTHRSSPTKLEFKF